MYFMGVTSVQKIFEFKRIRHIWRVSLKNDGIYHSLKLTYAKLKLFAAAIDSSLIWQKMRGFINISAI